MDVQVSYMRLLIGDNVQPYTYTDAQLRSAMLITGPRPVGIPQSVLVAGTLTRVTFPQGG